jgi:hypothetical protein
MAFPQTMVSVGTNTGMTAVALGALTFNPWAVKDVPIGSVQSDAPISSVQSSGSAQPTPGPSTAPEPYAAQPPQDPDDLVFKLSPEPERPAAGPAAVTPLLPPTPTAIPFPPEPPTHMKAEGWKLQITETTRWVKTTPPPDDATAQAAYKRQRVFPKPVQKGSVARILEEAAKRRKAAAGDELCDYPDDYLPCGDTREADAVVSGDTGEADAVVSGDTGGADGVVSGTGVEDVASSRDEHEADSDEEKVEGHEEEPDEEDRDFSQGPPHERPDGQCKFGPAWQRRTKDRAQAAEGNFEGFGVIL